MVTGTHKAKAPSDSEALVDTVNLCGFKPPLCGHLFRQPWEMDAG